MTNTLELSKTTIEQIITNAKLGENIKLTAGNIMVMFIKIGEYTGLIDTKKYKLHIIGSNKTFERISANIAEDDFKEDKTVDYTNTERDVLYLDYNTGLCLIETDTGCKLVYNTL
jgi:hypothetical protein